MIFDLLNALSILKKSFGNDAELILRQDDDSITIRVTAYYNNEACNSAFTVTREEIRNSIGNIFNIKFYKAIQMIKQKLYI